MGHMPKFRDPHMGVELAKTDSAYTVIIKFCYNSSRLNHYNFPTINRILEKCQVKRNCGLYIRVYSRITSIENEWIFNTLIINALTTIHPPLVAVNFASE